MTTQTKDTSVYPIFLYDLLSKEKVDQIPNLNLNDKRGSTDYIDFLRPTDLTAKIMKGVDIYKRHFITLQYEQDGKTKVITFFQRYTKSNTYWTYGGQAFKGLENIGGVCLKKEIINGIDNYKREMHNNFLNIFKKAINGEKIIKYKGYSEDMDINEMVDYTITI